MQTLQLSKPVVSIEPQARKTCTADRSKTKILGSKFKTFLKPPHLHHTCNIWQHVCFVRKSVRTFSSNVEHAGPGALITVAARKLPVSSAVFLPSPFCLQELSRAVEWYLNNPSAFNYTMLDNLLTYIGQSLSYVCI